MNDREAATLIGACSQLWPNVPMQAQYGPTMIRLWAAVLTDVTIDEAERAVVAHSRSGAQFPPAPGEIARLALDARASASGDLTPDADEAWAEIMAAVSSRGWYRGAPDTWSHPAVAAAVVALGWDEICHGDAMITRAHFVRMFPSIAARSTRDRHDHEMRTAYEIARRVDELPEITS